MELQVKYEGYIKRQEEDVKRFKRIEDLRIPDKVSFEDMDGLSKEVKEKLSTIRPVSIGQASRISGVTPAAIAVIMVNMKRSGII